ncbi:DUF1833 family protein [Aidingimonas halophila]|uniref:DUF1833 domain-containing protein n=1 Tax=Aidingimonas halophila TaxID=574349 RepID=A0A1H2RCW1_9GAMM|nr:DUF1833 family protein [Aidingimonas halophila]GHC19531.1 ArsR family transcriptional regulator [Aidingimonas halophila]SDW16684.1 protein of unknown function [Aidingimonas halophila]
MTILSTLYASAPVDEVLIPTLEISHPSFPDGPILTCTGFEDHTVTLETGEEVTFQGSGLDISLPSRDPSGQQNLQFAIENVTGIAQDAIDRALEAGGQIDVIYRSYIADQLSEPAEPPLKMVLVEPQFEGSTVQVTASFQDIINTAWPRDRYTATFAPGLRYIG